MLYTFRRLWFAGALLTAMLGASQPAKPQKPWVHRDAGNIDICQGFLSVPDEWNKGYLRLEVTRPPNLGADWGAELIYSSGQTVRIDEGLIERTAIGSSQDNPARIDIPLTGFGTLSVPRAPGGLSIRALTVSHPSRVNTQQRIDGSEVSFVVAGDELDRKVGLGFGRLDVMSRSKPLFSCSSFRVATGYWLTAAHCAVKAETIGARIQPYDYESSSQFVLPMSGQFIATGRVDGKWQADGREPTVDDLDYALVRVMDDPGGPTFKLTAAPASEGTPLLLLMDWPYDRAGKAQSEGKPCEIISLVGSTDRQGKTECYRAIQHGCTSDPGASGAALVRRDDPSHLIGLHYGGWKETYNCALPVELIRQHLCKFKLTIARGIPECF